eukprot:COSAG02_NODE_3765_length_6269_cov_7.859157_2_plen_344_part_00
MAAQGTCGDVHRGMNVLLITMDQLRRDAVGAMGIGRLNPRTPSFDALAAEGTVFAQHFTNSVPCGPSRSSLHTGLYAMNHRMVNNGTPLPDRHANWPRVYKSLGLDPVIIGYTSTAQDPRTHDPNDPILSQTHAVMPGFNPYLRSDTMDTTPKAWAADLEMKGYTHPAVQSLYTSYTTGDLPGQASAPSEWFGHSPGQLNADGSAFWNAEDSDSMFFCGKAKEYIMTRKQDEPWTLHLGLWRPHPPYSCSAPYHNMYDPNDLPKPVRAQTREAEAEAHPWLGWDESGRGNLGAPDTDEATALMRARYLGCVSEVDHAVGDLFNWLKSRGQWDRTLVVLTTDVR